MKISLLTYLYVVNESGWLTSFHRANIDSSQKALSNDIYILVYIIYIDTQLMRAQWLSGRVLDLRPSGRGFNTHWRHCVVSLSKYINPSLVLVQPRKTSPFITERLLMEHKESDKKQTNKILKLCIV